MDGLELGLLFAYISPSVLIFLHLYMIYMLTPAMPTFPRLLYSLLWVSFILIQ